MFGTKTYIVIVETEEEAYRLMKTAIRHKLYAAYKIGVYGSERQHELFVTGKTLNYYKFMRAHKKPITKNTGNQKK